MKANEIGDLARIFTDAGATFDMAFNMGAPIHGMMLSMATGLTFFAAVFGVAYATIGKMIGHNVDAGGVYRAVIMVSILLIPYDIAEYYQEEYLAQHAVYQEKLNENAATIGIKLPDRASHHNVSVVLFYYHRLATLITTSLLKIVDSFVDPGGDDLNSVTMSNDEKNPHGAVDSENKIRGNTAQLPSWVFEVWHAGYASNMTKTKPFYDLWTDYIRLCTPVAAKHPELDWKYVGLLGGLSLGRDTAFKDPLGDFFSWIPKIKSVEAQKEAHAAAVRDNFYDRLTLPLRKILAEAPLILKGVSPKPNGYYVPSRDYWIAKSSAADYKVPLRFIDNPFDHIRWTALQDTTLDEKSFPLKKAFFPTTCEDLYYVNDLAFTELKSAIGSASDMNMTQVGRETQTIGGQRVSVLSSYTVFATSMQNFSMSAFESEVIAAGKSLLEKWQEWKLLAHVPMMFGAITLAYSFMIMLFPVIAGFAVLPGRGSSIILFAHVLAYIHLVVFLLYFILKVGGMMLLGMSVSLANGVTGGVLFAKGISSQAMALETLIIMSVVGVFPIAYFLIFSDKAGLKGMTSKGLDAAGSAVATLGKAAATAMVAGKVLGAGKLASAIGGQMAPKLASKPSSTETPSSAATAAQQGNGGAGGGGGGGGSSGSGGASTTGTQNSGIGGGDHSWSKSSTGGARKGAATKLAAANAVAKGLSDRLNKS